MGEVTVGIDIGTTSVKAVAADAGGAVLAQAHVPHRLIAPDADRFEHDPQEAWIGGVVHAFETVSTGLDVVGAAVSAMVPSLCGVDDDGRPVTPGLLYGDARGRADASPTGVQGEVLGFARWIAGQPGVAALRPAQAVANHALCGVAAIDSSTAMTMAPLFGDGGWDREVVADLGLREEQLPQVAAGATAIGSRAGCRFAGGTVDALAEQQVSDARAPGDVLVICGATLIPWCLTDEWLEIDGLWTIPYSVRDIIAVGGASNAGGIFIDSVRRTVGEVDQADVLAVDPDSRPLWLPYIRGERTPFHDAGLRAALLDVELGHGPAEVLAAAYDAAGFVVRHHLDLVGGDPTRIVAAGGGTNAAAWMQALADTTGLPVDVSAHSMGAARGAAYTARLTAELETKPSGARRWAGVGRRVEPRAAHAAAANIRYARFRDVGP